MRSRTRIFEVWVRQNLAPPHQKPLKRGRSVASVWPFLYMCEKISRQIRSTTRQSEVRVSLWDLESA